MYFQELRRRRCDLLRRLGPRPTNEDNCDPQHSILDLSEFGMFPKQKFDGLLTLVGGFALHLTLGTLYCFGNMSTYMTSYLRKHVNSEITYSDVIWIPTLSTMSQGAFMTLSGHLEERVGVRFTLLIGSCIMTSGVYLSAFAIRCVGSSLF